MGSTGIIGAADTNYILKGKRRGNGATLLSSSRDVESQKLTLQFHDLIWELGSEKTAKKFIRQKSRNSFLGIVEFMDNRT